ncbi:glycosyltransferase family 4 protein [Methanoplanus endosymbiosus]|uniref:Glycosyltransferase family 4 protein n=1 Tax=Methanoplanus endosymbiosus TaxID=33865 RepID=A0A9E7TIC5_9EURY|nr:glycosyltransferase family 4 protein [Methanoplanus endosymbiosus]UUX92233.1 glycosyltransferase family 4 protein [Methanoplanus endosymbiosus]
MNILQVCPFFNPKRGGSVTILYDLSRELAKKGHQVTIITTDFDFDPDYAKSLKDVQVIKFNCLANIKEFYYSPSMRTWLKNNLQQFDIIHLHNFRSYQNNLVCHYAIKYNIPYVLQPHGSLPRIIEKQGLKRIYDHLWGNNILENSSKIIAVSNTEADQFRDIGRSNENIIVIPNGLNINSFNDLPPIGQFKKEYNIKEKHVVLYVGRIHKLKGIGFLIRTFSSFVREWGDDIVLIIAGADDGYTVTLEDLVKQLDLMNKVRFIGHISLVGALYQDADVLVYPSTYEIFGLVPFEALLCGTPVIVTDDCGCGELIKEAECGYTVHCGDVDDLSETLRYTIEHPDIDREMVNAGRHYIEEHLVWEKIVKHVEAMYEECIFHI